MSQPTPYEVAQVALWILPRERGWPNSQALHWAYNFLEDARLCIEANQKIKSEPESDSLLKCPFCLYVTLIEQGDGVWKCTNCHMTVKQHPLGPEPAKEYLDYKCPDCGWTCKVEKSWGLNGIVCPRCAQPKHAVTKRDL